MMFVPRAYQAEMLNRAMANPAYLAAVLMGAGKSVVALNYIDALLYDTMECERALIVAPLKTCETTWSSEPGKWDHLRHLRVSLTIGSEKQRRAALAESSDVVVINRDSFAWLVKHCGKRWPFDVVVWDESSGLKDHKSLRFRALKAVRKQIKRLLLLSGTPAPNSLLELWPQMWLIEPEVLGRTLSAYRDAFFQPDKRNGPQIYTWKLRPGAEEQIYARCAPYMMSLAPGDYPDIPERIDLDMPVALPERARSAYQTITHELVLGNTSAGSAAVLMGKLRQIASGRCYDDDGNVEHYHDEKFEALAEILEQADGPVLVFYDYQHTHDELVRRFGFRTDLDVKAWQRGEVTRLALHPASAGHGVDGLQEVGAPIVVVWVDIPWSLELWQQANARPHRQGLRYPVRVIRLVATGTVDELVCDALERKQISQDLLLEAIRHDENL